MSSVPHGGSSGLLGLLNPFERVRRVYHAVRGVRNKFPPHVRDFIKDNESAIIVEMNVGRKPIIKAIETAINYLTNDQFENAKEHLHYDDLFHLWLFVTLDNGTSFRFEKNHVVTITENPSISDSAERIDVELNGRSISLGEFVSNAVSMVGADIYRYDPGDNNCQVFIHNLLLANELLTPEVDEFIMQNTEEIIGSLPKKTRGLFSTLIDLAGRADILLYGEGKGNVFKEHIKNRMALKHKVLRY